MNNYDTQKLAEERNRGLAWGIQGRIAPSTINALNARNFQTHGDVAPVLSMTVTLPPRTGGPARDMLMRIFYVEGLEMFDVHTEFFRENGMYQSDAIITGIHNENLDNSLMGLIRGNQRTRNATP